MCSCGAAVSRESWLKSYLIGAMAFFTECGGVEVCWWESVVALQTIALVMVSTFGFGLGSYYQCLVTVALLGLVLLLLLWVRPFKCRAVNAVAVQSMCVLLVTAYVALTLLPYNSVQPGPAYGNTMGVLLVLLHLAFFAMTVRKLAHVVDWSAARQLVRRILSSACGIGRCSNLPGGGVSAGIGAAHMAEFETDDIEIVGFERQQLPK